MIDPAVASYVDAYVAGWARSRRTPRPQPVSHGWHVPTGTPAEPERYVLTSGTVDDVRRFQDAMPDPGSCLKFAGNRQDWLFLADAAWEENPIGWFMTRDLDPAGTSPSPIGEVTEATVRDHVAVVTVEHEGQEIASGRAGLHDLWAVPDRIRTSPAYQRRGLGRFVMQRLLSLAHEAGARHAILDASPEGRELYLATGWVTVAGQFGINRICRDPR